MTIPVLYNYRNDTMREDIYEDNYMEKSIHNTRQKYLNVIKLLNKHQFIYYGNEINSFYDALTIYDLNGKEVLIYGLAGCNCDAIAIWKNARKVYVVDYNKPRCDHERIEVVSHDELDTRDLQVDCAFSYSSFEHDGLGRYGDPISANADLDAMHKAHTILKKDGILFLGVPVGTDCIVWNLHRIYGRKRLPLLLKGWHCVDVFNAYKPCTPEFPFDLPLGSTGCQFLFVLKKINTDYPDNRVLDIQISSTEESSINSTRSPEILKRIARIIRKYKNDHCYKN